MQNSCPTAISHERGNVYFNFRTCGIAIKDGKVLAVKIAPYDFFLFSCGRVEYLELSQTALICEIKEVVASAHQYLASHQAAQTSKASAAAAQADYEKTKLGSDRTQIFDIIDVDI